MHKLLQSDTAHNIVAGGGASSLYFFDQGDVKTVKIALIGLILSAVTQITTSLIKKLIKNLNGTQKTNS